jgi:hypothetical protein
MASLAAPALFVLGVITVLSATGKEARYIDALPWKVQHVAHVIGLGYSELGSDASRSHADVQTIGGQSCVVGNAVSFDVDDSYAFDIDEPVDLTLTYVPERTTAEAIVVLYDKSGGDGRGSAEITPQRGAGLQRSTIRLDRARFAGMGATNTDFAVTGRRGIVALCGLEITRTGATKTPTAFGQVRLDIKDAATGRAVPARIGLYDSTGRMPLPSDRAIPVLRFTDEIRRMWLNRRTFWPSESREAFYANGSYEARVPVGTYELVATRGPEYRAFRQTVDVRPNAASNVSVTLTRYDDLPKRGWFSGESHLHLQRNQVGEPAVWAQVAAEDLHLANLLEMGNITNTYFRQPAWGQNGRYLRDGVALVSGQEDPRTVMRGHTIHWNIQQPTHAPEVFFQYQYAFERSRSQGGLTGYAHLGELFNGRRGLAIDVPFGLVDFIEVLQGGRINTDIWYSFLNLGYKVLPVGGADFPYFGPTLPGVERTYVSVDGPFSIDGWYNAFRRGHAYVTNGPFLEFTVNGRQMGEELHVARGTRLDVAAAATLNPDIDKLDRLELVVLGDIATQESAGGRDRVELKKELTADHSMWIAVRAYGQGPQSAALAHSAPIYVVVDDEPTWKAEAVEELVALQREQLTQLLTVPIDPEGDLEAFETRETLLAEWKAQLPKLTPRIHEAEAKYQALLDHFHQLHKR